MKYNCINLMLPTYGRSSTKLPVFLKSIEDTVSSFDNICITFCVNEKDKGTIEYLKNKEFGYDTSIVYEKLDKPHLAKYFNMMYGKHVDLFGDDVIVSMVGDDMIFKTHGWDKIIIDNVNYYGGIGIFYGDDCFAWHDKLCVNMFTTTRMVDALKPLPYMCEEFPMDMIDIVWQRTAEKLGWAFYLPNVKIYHDHETRRQERDDTYKRLRELFPVSDQKRDIIEEYSDRCVANIKTNLKFYLNNDIDVILTTCDRDNLLIKFVNSYTNSIALPEKIHIFDDCSKNGNRINEIITRLPGAIYKSRENRLGVNGNTPEALKEMFGKGSKSVLILDSDTIFHPGWWIRLNYIYEEAMRSGGFDVINLFNDRNVPVIKPCFDGVCHEKGIVGAFGSLITRESYEKHIVPYIGSTNVGWDNLMSKSIRESNGKIYVSTPSFIQHTGYADGSHGGGATSSYADDFVGTDYFDSDHCRGKGNIRKDVLFVLYARNGDIIQGSMVANMIHKKGYSVDFITLPRYLDLAECICPDIGVYPEKFMPDVEASWWYTTTSVLKEWYPGYRYYINAQFGAPENHDDYMRSGLPPLEWLTRRCESIICDTFPRDWTKYLCHRPIKDVQIHQLNQNKPLAIIAPEAITSRAIDEHMAQNIVWQLEGQGYNVRQLVSSRPNQSFRIIRNKYVWCKDFTGVINIIERCDLFVGNDSGPAWASLFSKCKKRIYHRKERVEKTNTYFSKLDSNAEDVLI